MIRCTIEILPAGDESKARTIGLVEIANVGGDLETGKYRAVLTKTPPFSGALKAAWKRGFFEGEDENIIAASVGAMSRDKRGSYDLLYRALKACGLGERNP